MATRSLLSAGRLLARTRVSQCAWRPFLRVSPLGVQYAASRPAAMASAYTQTRTVSSSPARMDSDPVSAAVAEGEKERQQKVARAVLERWLKLADDERVMNQLQMIHEMEGGEVMQWQYLMGTLQGVVDQCVAEVFQAASQEPPTNFSAFLCDVCATEGGEDIKEAHGRFWARVIDAAFGEGLLAVGEGEKTGFTLREARRYISQLVEIFMDSPVLDGMREVLGQPEWSDMEGRMQCVQSVLMPEHMKVLKKFGFEGERGYVLAQRSLLVDHMPDKVIMDQADVLSHIVVKYTHLEKPADE